MQTHFSPAQLADPEIADANAIFRACVHCGFCNATCPTYLLTGDELDGPRGRIYLIKDMLEADRPPAPSDVIHIDRCLSCLSCMTTCPSGVNYMHLVDHARAHIERRWVRKMPERLLRSLLGRVLPRPGLAGPLMALARLAAPVAGLLPRNMQRMVGLATSEKHRSKVLTPKIYPAKGETRYRVALLAGCVQQVLDGDINAATIRLLTRHGCEIVIARGAGCCGAVNHHLGQEQAGKALAAANLRAWMDITGNVDAVIANTSGCGTMVKDYGHLFRNDPQLAETARVISDKTRDVCEFIDEIGLMAPVIETGQRVAYQSPCSIQHGQGVQAQPVSLLRSAGFTVAEPRDAHLCCGSAGTYNILQGDMADTLRDRKVTAIDALAPDLVASGNIGCMSQLQAALNAPILHSVELLDWATGGPEPYAVTQKRSEVLK
jgi:glycolate oxidase iron-sulfur subunit